MGPRGKREVRSHVGAFRSFVGAPAGPAPARTGAGRALEGEIKDDRIELRRTEKEKRPILQRLKRIEGQVRGLQNMIAEDRYCLDEVQQINAMTAALREVALLIISQHVSCGIHIALEDDHRKLAVEDVMRLLRSAMKPVG